jgi:hypothetical protein
MDVELEELDYAIRAQEGPPRSGPATTLLASDRP